MESKIKTVKVKLADGTVEYYYLTEEEYNSWEVRPEGYLNCNGIIAYYEHGESKEAQATNRLYGGVENMPHAGITLEGDGIQGYKKDLLFMTDFFFEGFDQYGKQLRHLNADKGWKNPPIEYYVQDPTILDFFYNKYPHKKDIVRLTNVVALNPHFEEQEVPFRMAA